MPARTPFPGPVRRPGQPYTPPPGPGSTILANNFSGLANGTTLTPGNSGTPSGNAFDSASVTAGSTLASDNTHARGLSPVSLQIATPGGGGGSAFVQWSTSLVSGFTQRVQYRIYLYFTAIPTVSTRIFAALNTTATTASSTLVNTSGKILVASTTGGTISTSTTTIPLNAWFRVEGWVFADAAVGQTEVRIYTNPDATIDGYAEINTSAANKNTSSNINIVRLGVSNTAISAGPFWLSAPALTQQHAYIGPELPILYLPADLTFGSADSGSGDDEGSVSVLITDTDSGSGADAGSIAASLSGSDTGSGDDEGGWSGSFSDADAGSGAEASTIVASLSSPDTGSGAEGAGSIRSSGSYDNVVLADNPVLYVTGTVADVSGHSHTVTKHGLPTATAALPNGDPGWAFDSSGTEYLAVADADDLSVVTTGALTVECWLSPSAVNQPHSIDTGYVNFIGKTGFFTPPGSNQYEWELRYFNQSTTDTGNVGESLCGYAFTSLAGGIGFGHDDAHGVTVGQWIHTVIVYDCTSSPSRVTIYRNGVQVNTTTFTGTPQNGTNPLTIGASETGESDTSYWYGWLGKIAVYPTVLSSSRILAHFEAMTATSSGDNGTAVEAATVGPVDGDVGTGSEQQFNNNTVDAATGADAQSLVVDVSDTDAGTGTDAIATLAVTVPGETASGTDAGVLSTSHGVTDADAGSGADAQRLAVVSADALAGLDIGKLAVRAGDLAFGGDASNAPGFPGGVPPSPAPLIYEGFSISSLGVLPPGEALAAGMLYGVQSVQISPQWIETITHRDDWTELVWEAPGTITMSVQGGFMPWDVLAAIYGLTVSQVQSVYTSTYGSTYGSTAGGAISLPLLRQASPAALPIIASVTAKRSDGNLSTLLVIFYAGTFGPLSFTGPAYKNGLVVSYSVALTLSPTDETGAPITPAYGRIEAHNSPKPAVHVASGDSATGAEASAISASLPAADTGTAVEHSGSFGGYDSVIAGDSPVAYWTLTDLSPVGGLFDKSGNGHQATPFITPAITTFLDGGGALAFDGFTQYLEVPSAVPLSVTGTGIMTIEAWMRPDTLTFPREEQTGYVHWLGKGDATNGFEYVSRMYGLDNTEGRFNRISGYEFNPVGGLGSGAYFQDTVVAGNWIHYVLVINSVNTSTAFPTGYVTIYKNGVLRQTRGLNAFNVVPGYSTTPLRMATRDFASFFQGALAKVALYGYELSPTQIRNHYQTIVPIPPGSAALIDSVGSFKGTGGVTSGIITLTETVPAGSTIIVKCVHDNTTGAPGCQDSKGNVYTRDRTAASATLNIRASMFSGQINAALEAGDQIKVSPSALVQTLVYEASAFSGVLFGGAAANVDVFNSTSGSNTTPGTTIPLVTTNANDLVLGFVGVQGPLADSYTEDMIFPWVTMARQGTSGGTPDFTVDSAYDSVASTGTYNYRPTLGTSRNWVEIIGAYKGGTPTVTPPSNGTGQFIQHVGAASSITLGTGLTIAVPSSIPVGHTLIAQVLCDYTTGTTSITDSAGNTWSIARAISDAAHTQLAVMLYAPVTTQLNFGDHIVVTTGSVVTRMSTVDEFSQLINPVVLDGSNSAGGNSSTPQLGSGVTTAHADDMLIAATYVEAPAADPYFDDTFGLWTSLTSVGTTGSSTLDQTIHPVYRPVGSTGTYNYRPTLGNSRVWGEMLVAFECS